MATTYTENYHLGKQENHADKFRMDVITANMDIIDAQMKKNEDEIASAKGTYTTLSERLNAIESEQESQGAALDEDRAAIVELVDGGAKNVLNYTEIGTNASHGTTFVSNGVTYTLNSDFSITAERTETSTVDSSCNLRIASSSLYVDAFCNGNYILSGCPEGGGDTAYSLRAIRDDYRPTDTGNGVELPDKGANTNIYINMLVMAAFEGTVTFRPMICTKAAWDISQQYVPYRPCYDELIARLEALEGGV
jgi:hypothetical protein